MKKIITSGFILLAIIILRNCSPKAGKQVASDDTKKTESTSVPASKKSVVMEAQENRTDAEQVDFLMKMSQIRQDQGKQLYEASCGKCHKLYKTDKHDATGWVKVMKRMGPKARLQASQYNMISAYLVQNAKH